MADFPRVCLFFLEERLGSRGDACADPLKGAHARALPQIFYCQIFPGQDLGQVQKNVLPHELAHKEQFFAVL